MTEQENKETKRTEKKMMEKQEQEALRAVILQDLKDMDLMTLRDIVGGDLSVIPSDWGDLSVTGKKGYIKYIVRQAFEHHLEKHLNDDMRDLLIHEADMRKHIVDTLYYADTTPDKILSVQWTHRDFLQLMLDRESDSDLVAFVSGLRGPDKPNGIPDMLKEAVTTMLRGAEFDNALSHKTSYDMDIQDAMRMISAHISKHLVDTGDEDRTGVDMLLNHYITHLERAMEIYYQYFSDMPKVGDRYIHTHNKDALEDLNHTLGNICVELSYLTDTLSRRLVGLKYTFNYGVQVAKVIIRVKMFWLQFMNDWITQMIMIEESYTPVV